MEYKTGLDIINDDDEQHVDESNGITVTGEEWWLKVFGLTDELPWPQEEADDSSISQTYENTPCLNVSIAGEDIDEIGYSKEQTSLGVTVEQPQSNIWDQR